MTSLAEHPVLGRATALGVLAFLIVLFCAGPLAGYCELIAGNSDALAGKAALLQRYRALADAGSPPSATPGLSLLYPDIPESQASALLQETVKNAAATAHAQVLGLQVLRAETTSGATRIGVRVRASGDMVSLRSLLYTVETARPLLHPDNLSIQSHAAAPNAEPSALDFQLDVSAFKTERLQ